MKILIVDDETPIREWIQFSIERGNRSEFKVAGAVESGNEAYEEALKQRVDVVISDIKMPGMDGMTLMKKLMKDMPGISFIILTNHAEFDYAREAVTYGAKKYLLKSELRGEDILKALDEIYEEKKTAERDCFSNGYLDTYSCSHHREDEVFIREFWYKHHFAENLPFQVIGIKKEESDEKLVIDEFFERQKVNILRPILREENIFILVQGEKEAEIEDAVKSFGLFWMQREEGKKIVISGRMRKESTEIMEAVEEAESMLHYSFFMKEGCLSTEDVGKYASLDRKMIKKEYYQILNNIFYGKNPEMGRRVQLWFENFQKVPLEDLNWAKTTCIRFTEHLEELCQERLGSEEEMRNNLDWTLQNCMELCLSLIERIYSGDKMRYSQSIREAAAYIRENYMNQNLSLKEVAAAVYRSPEYLSRLFKIETGQNFSTYLMRYRLKKAKELLANTDMKIYEIAFAVGYTTPSYFSKVYKDYMGVTPETDRCQKSDKMSGN